MVRITQTVLPSSARRAKPLFEKQFTARIAATILVGTASTLRAEARAGNVDGAIELSRDALEGRDDLRRQAVSRASHFHFLVEALLRRRGSDTDLREAQSAIDQLAAMPIEPGFVMHEIWLLRMRALRPVLAATSAAYRNYRDRYRAMARALGFEGHIALGRAMP